MSTFGVAGQGSGSLSPSTVPIPANPALVGLELFARAALLAAPGSFEGSNANAVAISR